MNCVNIRMQGATIKKKKKKRISYFHEGHSEYSSAFISALTSCNRESKKVPYTTHILLFPKVSTLKMEPGYSSEMSPSATQS